MLKEITFKNAKERAITGEKGILITMPQPMDQLTIDEILVLEKAGAICLIEDREMERIREPAIMIEDVEEPCITGVGIPEKGRKAHG